MIKYLKYTFLLLILNITFISFACGDKKEEQTPTPEEKEEFYECTEYNLSMKFVSGDGIIETADNYLEYYNYYRIYINENNSICKLVYKEIGDSLEKTVQGVYSKQANDIIIIKFKSYAMEPNNIYFKIIDNSLVRIDETTKQPGDNVTFPSRGIIYQTFEK